MTYHWTLGEIENLRGQRFLVTGANSGIGYSTCLELAKKGATIVMASRDLRKLDDALARIRESVPGAILEPLILDLASLSSVKSAAEEELEKQLPLNVLINNAGVMAPPKRLLTQDGYELQFGTNVLGHFALTQRLLPLLERAESARVVNVASVAHKRGRFQFHDLHWENSYDPMKSYAQSKLANLVFSLELERRLRQASSSVMSVACHPGVANTNLFVTGDYGVIEKAIRKVASLIIGLFLNSELQGAVPTLFAASSKLVQGGCYYGPRGVREIRGGNVGRADIRPQALDEESAQRLWDICEELTCLNFLSK